MSKTIQNKGWNSMKSLLDDHMPVQNNHKGKLILLGLLFISIAWILGYYFGKNSDSQSHVTPVASLNEKSDIPSSIENKLDNAVSNSKAKQQVVTEKDFVGAEEHLSKPTKRNRTLVEISPVKQVELRVHHNEISNQSIFESYIEEAKLSSREEVLYESPTIPSEDFSSIPADGKNYIDKKMKDNIISDKSILVIDESVVENEMVETLNTNIEPEKIKQRKHLFSIGAAATTQAYALRHVGIQSGFEYSYRFNPKWAWYINSGAELRNIYHTNQQALIKESKLNNQVVEVSFSLNGKHNVAQVDYDYMVSAYVGTGVQYYITPKWNLYTGFTFHPLISVVKRSVSHLPTYADGSVNNEILYPDEIELNYNMIQNYEFSTTLGLTYFPTSKIGVSMYYQHGFRGLLKYDLRNFDLTRRGIGLGIQYIF